MARTGPGSGRAAEAGTFDDVAGFRNGRGRDNRPPHNRPQQAPYGHDAAPPPYPQQQWQQPPQGQPYGRQGQQQPYGEPEYFGDPYGQPQHPHAATANNPGHTQMFSVDDPYAQGGPAPAPVPTGPRLPWKPLLSGIVLRPADTFLRMRDHAVWGPALIVTFLYGLLAIFGFDKARDEAINATLSTAIPYVLMTATGFVVGGLILGAVTHTLARQLGGDGAWQPTVGLSMLIMSITDAPRLIFALFLGGENGLVQVIGWVTWLAAGALFTMMVSRSHDLPWPKALGASAIQLVALLSLIKLGTL
ncbi:putative integral membrane protein [Streptomyces venezuelae ATCC 10712]|uniref:Putative integral membrane protein n=1 Tax=Streptomyces venezuelae (strain ATCC 10712 / CBS 650.69 / DSM 40230 / JCM 4526 / NBRC 13096 / PD 04745) TaxID=953739 RepID=F2RBL2_STRVP|nr:putative integral membrane protein [Streptomyces venezuelae ATCC 10712]